MKLSLFPRLTLVAMLFALLGNARTHAQPPEYAQWGKVAMDRTKAKYPGAIIDYWHVGRTQVSADIAEEKFKLWLRNGTLEYGVWVTIRFYTANDRIITIDLSKKDR
ncbi:DUF3889 domain-containing protein [Cohnella endophytica]|uniref:DUF3889 domain-containing protein n=1 Tax=Cohnella endophytica TaxID=2419778 RepID=A0A494Y468_9BACL|nr:DUF3889 domain-containing protein [Cohnella endophytica]RKP56820.1 DUF3889 domain-containing protein [Cohnella endophytica]